MGKFMRQVLLRFKPQDTRVIVQEPVQDNNE